MDSSKCINETEKYKIKVKNIIQNKGYVSIMNNTKWKELKKGVSELPFLPPFVIKAVDEEETEYHRFLHDEYRSGDWGLYLDNYYAASFLITPSSRTENRKHGTSNVVPCFF